MGSGGGKWGVEVVSRGRGWRWYVGGGGGKWGVGGWTGSTEQLKNNQ